MLYYSFVAPFHSCRGSICPRDRCRACPACAPRRTGSVTIASMYSLRFGDSLNWGLPRRPHQQQRRKLRSGDGATATGSETLAQRIGVSVFANGPVEGCPLRIDRGRMGDHEISQRC